MVCSERSRYLLHEIWVWRGCPLQRFSVVFLVMLLTIGAVAYYAPHRYAYKIMALFGLVPLAVRLQEADVGLDARILAAHERLHLEVVEAVRVAGRVDDAEGRLDRDRRPWLARGARRGPSP